MASNPSWPGRRRLARRDRVSARFSFSPTHDAPHLLHVPPLCPQDVAPSQQRVRNNNAYLLFYERANHPSFQQTVIVSTILTTHAYANLAHSQ